MKGTTLAHYEIGESLGRGGMGEVFRARDTNLERDVALKVLPAGMASDPARRERFEREAKIVASLNHPNIVTIYSVEEVDGVQFLTMELVEGVSLSQMIVPGGMMPAAILDIALPVADALEAAHKAGVVHRDLKPDNIMLTREGRVKVLDFGLAKLRDPVVKESADTMIKKQTLTGENQIVGTVAYMSPEQAEGREVDGRSDIFSLGIVMYQLATGERPFKGDTPISTMSAIIKDTPTPISDIKPTQPEELDRIIHTSLAKRPGDRYANAEELRRALAGLQKELESGEATPAAKKSGRRPLIAGVGVIAIIALVLLGSRLLQKSPTEGTTETSTTVTSEHTDDRRMIVVMPFDNLGDPEDAYFTDGITEEITSRLASVNGLGVISRNSAIQYDKTGKTTKQLGEDLGVEFVLEGAVRWAQDPDGASRVRITPQLVRVSDDTSVWSSSYDRVMEDIFEVQSDIAENVIEELGITLLDNERRALVDRPTENLEAYSAYLRGRHHEDNFSERSVNLAIEMYERALELDPTFVVSAARLARAHASKYHFGWDRSDSLANTAAKYAELALEADAESVHARVAMGYVYYHVYRQYDRAEAEFEIAEKKLPNDASLWEARSYVERRQGKLEEALASSERALVLSPRDARITAGHAYTLGMARRYEEALSHYDRAIQLQPDIPSYRHLKMLVLWNHTGDPRDAAPVAAAIHERGLYTDWSCWFLFMQSVYEERYDDAQRDLWVTPDSVYVFSPRVFPKVLLSGWARGLAGHEDADEHLKLARAATERQLQDDPEDYRYMMAAGLALAALGQSERATELGERALAKRPPAADLIEGTVLMEDLAWLYTMAGDYDRAIDLLDKLLNMPSFVSSRLIEMDPRWAPLREHSRYEILLRNL